MKKTTIKTFKRFIKEENEKWYSLDLYSDMNKEDVIYYMNELIPLTLKMLKNTLRYYFEFDCKEPGMFHGKKVTKLQMLV